MPNQNYYMKKCDKLWSEHWHKSRICEVGIITFDCQGTVHAHHLIGRGRKATRCLLENGMRLCEFHHTGSTELSAHKGQAGFEKFMVEFYPVRWNWVLRKRNEFLKKPDFKNLYVQLTDDAKRAR